MAAEFETNQEKVSIKIVKAKKLHGSKGNQITAVARVEFGSSLLGESAKIEYDSAAGCFPFDFSCFLNIGKDDPYVLDELVQTPIVLTFSEILPKDKKSKEEKSVVLGQCCVDLLPLLRGDLGYTVVERIHTAGSIETQDSPEVEINISCLNPILSEEQQNTCNLLTLCVESLFSIPEPWINGGSQFLYAAAMPIPISAEKEGLVLIPTGLYRAAGEQEVSQQRRWSCLPNASGSCIYIPNTEIHTSSYEDEDGDLRGAQDVSFRQEAEKTKPHITWNAERRCFLSTQAAKNLQQAIAEQRYWPFEVFRTSAQAGDKKKKEEEPLASYHGIAYVDLAPLLYPGVRKVRGAYLIQPYMENVCVGKIKRKGVVTEDVARSIIGINRSSSSLGQAKGKAGKADAKPKPSGVNLRPDGTVDDQPVACSEESQQFVDARTYITLEIELEQPLVQKRETEIIAKRIAELIPPRPLFPKKSGGAQKAIKNYKEQIGNIADILLEEFRVMFGANLNPVSGAAEERRRQFLYELNTSGKYFAFKEQLKYCVVKLVREKFMHTKKFETKEQLQAFISELYPFLLEHMNSGLNEYLSKEEMIEVPKNLVDPNMLKFFAKEAEGMYRYDLAAKHYQERVARNRNDAENWYDYGTFCLLIEDMQKAEECFHEVVSINQKHMRGLVMNGYLAMLHEDYRKSEEFFEAATYMAADDPLSWTLLGLFHSGVENTIMAERSFNTALKLICRKNSTSRDEPSTDVNATKPVEEVLKVEEVTETFAVGEADAESAKDDITDKMADLTVEENVKRKVEPNPAKIVKSIFLEAAEFCLSNHLTQLAERALAHELVSSRRGPLHMYFQLLARLHVKRQEHDQAFECLQQALAVKHVNPNAWAMKGHVYYMTEQWLDARESYERCLAYVEQAQDLHPIYLRLAHIYLNRDKKYLKAKDMYLKATNCFPTCVTWQGVGISCYKLNDLDEAETALNEANILDNRNAEVWAYLTLVCLKKKRHLDAEQCYKYALRLNLENNELLSEIKETMTETKFDMSLL